MQIKLSRYNAPFCEPPEDGVHYISLDDQRDIRTGHLDAHVRLFLSQKKIRTIEVTNTLTGETLVHDITNTFYIPPFSKTPVSVISADDVKFLDELYYDCGIKSAGKRTKRWM